MPSPSHQKSFNFKELLGKLPVRCNGNLPRSLSRTLAPHALVMSTTSNKSVNLTFFYVSFHTFRATMVAVATERAVSRDTSV
jgi:hypothetical protein